MKPAALIRYILLPAAIFASVVKAGDEYATSTYVSRDRKFIKGKVIKDE